MTVIASFKVSGTDDVLLLFLVEFVALLLVAAGLYGFALWIQCTRAVRDSGIQVTRRALQPSECGGQEEV